MSKKEESKIECMSTEVVANKIYVLVFKKYHYVDTVILISYLFVVVVNRDEVKKRPTFSLTSKSTIIPTE